MMVIWTGDEDPFKREDPTFGEMFTLVIVTVVVTLAFIWMIIANLGI